MPQIFIEAPAGIEPEAKRELMREVSAAVEAAYPIPDVRVWLREYEDGNYAQDGVVGAGPIRPVVFLEAPVLDDLDTKRVMSARIQDALAKGYAGLANTDETLVLMNHYPLENAGFGGRLASDPEVLAS